jgi:CRP-like cAMP-binding protein
MNESWLPSLLKCQLFEGFDTDAIKSLLPCFNAISQDFAKGDILKQAGDPQQTIGIMLEGEVQVLKEDYAGNRLIIGIFGPGEIYGEVAAFAGINRWPNTVVASTDGAVLYVPFIKITQPCCRVCDAHQRMIRNMLGIVAGKAMIMNNRIGFLKMKGMREKLTAFLYDQYRQSGNRTFLIPMNRSDLADFLNVSRPSMSRELGRMREEGLIDYFRSSFTIKDRALPCFLVTQTSPRP